MNKKSIKLAVLVLATLTFSNANASAHEEKNIKMHCAILKDGKVIKQQQCVADGYVHAGAMYGGGSGYTFKPIKGYGSISVDLSLDALKDKHGNLIEKANGVQMVSKYFINNKDAISRYRMPKTFKLLTPAEEKRYDNGELKEKPYTCFIQKHKPKYEFCFSEPLMG